MRFRIVAAAMFITLLFVSTRSGFAQDIWNLNLAPSPGGHIDTVVEVPGLDSFELRPGGLFHVYTWYWIEWFTQSTSSCSSASASNCSLTLPATYTTIDVPIEDGSGTLGDLVRIPVVEPSWRVTYTAVPDPGYYFIGWGSSACADQWPSLLGGGRIMSCQPGYPDDTDLTPLFSQCPPGASCVTVQAAPSAIGTVQLRPGDASAPVAFTCDTLCTFQVTPGTNWVLTTTTANGALLSEWNGCDTTPADGSCTLNVSGERRVGARFKFPLVVTNSSPFVSLWVDEGRKYLGACDSTTSPCTYLLDPGAQVGLTRRANPPAIGSYRFTQSWQGCTPRVYPGTTAETTTFCDITMNGPRAAQSVYFDEWHFVVQQPQHGRISSSPAGIDCSSTSSQCDAWFPVYSTPVFTATPDPGYTFFGWNDGRVGYPGGDCAAAGSSPVCSDYLNHEPRLTGASFYPQLTVQIVGGGGVLPTVTSASPYDTGAACPATAPNICVAVAPGSNVSLAPTGFPGYTFSGWAGACTGAGPCSPQVNAPATVTATFTGTHKLLVSTGAFGVVGLSSTPFRTRCNYGCDTSDPNFGGSSVEYSAGTAVNLIAVSGTVAAYSNYVFTGWGGICSGKSPTCTIAMGTETVDADGFSRAQANFTYGSNVQTVTSGQGRITSDLPGVNCSGSCFQYIAVGTLTTLTATPDPGWIFSGWSGGGCSGTGTCTPNIFYDPPYGAGNAPITATFVPANADLAALSLSKGTLSPAFAASVAAYTADVRTGYSGLTLIPTAGDATSTIKVRANGAAYQSVASGSASGLLALNVGVNTLDVLVTAVDGITSKTYTVTVTRAAILVPGDADPAFNFSFGSSVWAATVQPDGKVLVAGGFWGIPSIPDYLARFNPDGTLDTGFNAGLNNAPLAISVQGDGKILIGGSFTSIGGVPRNRIARLNQDGTLDAGFNPDANDAIRTFLIQPDGKVVIAGQFTTVGGVPRNRIARLNEDGTLDTGFNPDVNNMIVRAVLLRDRKILIAGFFSSVGGATRFYVARLNPDGTLDSGFNPNPNNGLAGMAQQADGKILITGFFTSIAGGSRNHMARLNEDGTLDAAFNPPVNGFPISLALQADGKILLAGDGMTFGGVARTRVARLNADGTLDPAFDPDASNFVRSLAVQKDGKVIGVGDFSIMGGATHNRIARLENDPATDALSLPSADRVQWLRGGTSPETQAVSFELSTDGGSTYSPLGVGARISGGWELAGLSLPTSGRIRARAQVVSLGEGASSGLVESVVTFSSGGPEVEVSGRGMDIANGDATPSAADGTDFGAATSGGGSVLQTFTVANSGSAALSLGTIALSGANAGEFFVASAPAASVAAGATTTFQLRFDPGAIGVRSATVTFPNNDQDENPFTFSIQGTAVPPLCPTIALGPLSDKALGTPYSGSVAASGGIGPYTYSVTSDSLPPGLSLSSSGPGAGSVTGIPYSAGTFTFDVTATDTAGTGTCTGERSYTVVIGSAVSSGNVVISEFRFRGPAGSADEYVEISNRTSSDIVVVSTDGSPGWVIVGPAGVVATIPNGAVIRPRGHWLATGAQFGLSTYGGSYQSVGAGDGAMSYDLPDDTGVALFTGASGTPLDAVGFSGAIYREGAGLQPLGLAPPSFDYAHVRKHLETSFVLQDTDANLNDFQFVATNGGTYNGAPAMVGAPGPQSLASGQESGFSWQVLDPAVAAGAAPNRVRVGSGNAGTLEFRQRLRNQTGAPVRKLRVRLVAVTTYSGGASPGGTTADLRPITSSDATVSTSFGSVLVRGVVLEESPMTYALTNESAPNGGWNTSLVVPLSAPVPAGGFVDINLKFALAKAGTFSWRAIAEFLP